MLRERMTEALVEKAQMRALSDGLVERWLDGGGKVKRVACTGKSPNHGKRGGFVADRSTIRYGAAVRGRGMSAFVTR